MAEVLPGKSELSFTSHHCEDGRRSTRVLRTLLLLVWVLLPGKEEVNTVSRSQAVKSKTAFLQKGFRQVLWEMQETGIQPKEKQEQI